MTTWPLQRECDAYFGDPRGAGGKASAKWESRNLVLVPCPWLLRFDGTPVRGIRIHSKAAPSLSRALSAIWDRLGHSQAIVDHIGMSIYGGGYNYRLMRGGSSLSMHSWGCAVDFDPVRNGLGDRTPAMDRRVIEEFEREGWEWGGHWSRPDGMHFQAARTRSSPQRLTPSVQTDAAVMAGVRGTLDGAQAVASKRPLTATETRAVQIALRTVGFTQVGAADGIIGPRSRAALQAFQRKAGITVTGRADSPTLARLVEQLPKAAA